MTRIKFIVWDKFGGVIKHEITYVRANIETEANKIYGQYGKDFRKLISIYYESGQNKEYRNF